MKKWPVAIVAATMLSGCGFFEMTVKDKRHINSFVEYVDCRYDVDCPGDGFLEVTRPECWELVFNDLGGEIRSCMPKKVWDRTKIGEVWHSQSFEEKSR